MWSIKGDKSTSKEQPVPNTPPSSTTSDVIMTWKSVQSGLVATTPPLSLNTTLTPSTDDEHDVTNDSYTIEHDVIQPKKLFEEMSELVSALKDSQAQNEQKDIVIASLRAELASVKMGADMDALTKVLTKGSYEIVVRELANAKESICEKNEQVKSLQIKLLKLNTVTEKTNTTLAEKVSELDKATAQIASLEKRITKYQERRITDDEEYEEELNKLKARILRRDSTIEQLQKQLISSSSSNSASHALISSSSRTSGIGSTLTTTSTNDAPRCKDGTLDMRYKVNQGKSKTEGISSSGAMVSSSYYGSGGWGGGGYAVTTSSAPRCKDGSYDMRYSCNRGKSKYG